MVTHSWENLFRDLVAAVLADAMHETTFEVWLGAKSIFKFLTVSGSGTVYRKTPRYVKIC